MLSKPVIFAPRKPGSASRTPFARGCGSTCSPRFHDLAVEAAVHIRILLRRVIVVAERGRRVAVEGIESRGRASRPAR